MRRGCSDRLGGVRCRDAAAPVGLVVEAAPTAVVAVAATAWPVAGLSHSCPWPWTFEVDQEPVRSAWLCPPEEGIRLASGSASHLPSYHLEWRPLLVSVEYL